MGTENSKIEGESSRRLELIHGPFFVEYLVHPDGKQFIMLLGEWHSKYTEKCRDRKSVDVSDFIQNVVSKNPNYFFDMFLEFPYKEIKKQFKTFKTKFLEYTPSEAAKHIGKDLIGCITREENSCKYKNLRFHLVDIRLLPSVRGFRYLKEILDEEDMNDPTKIQELKDTIEMVQITRDKDDTPRMVKLMNKEISRIHPEFRRYLPNAMAHFENSIKDVATLPEKMDKIVEELSNYRLDRKGTPQKSIKYYNNLAGTVSANDIVLVNIFDTYTIGRILHKFKNSGSAPDRCKNCIVYAGGLHTENMSKFFQSIGYKVAFRSVLKNLYQCAEVDVNIKKYLVS